MTPGYKPLVAAKPVPPLDMPSGSTVSVQLIDSTTRMIFHRHMILGPRVPGEDAMMRCPAYSFLVEHPSGRKLLYDLGTRKDTENFSPTVRSMFASLGWTFAADKHVADILSENGVALDSIEAVVWSHWHYDHTGNMKTFPSSVKLIVGPDFKKLLTPGYPTNPTSLLTESDWEGRDLVELDFAKHVKLGRFRAIDYFEDGSFYLLDAPGHAIGHVSALARVSKGSCPGEDDTFIFMAGDLCHHGGLYKPNDYLPLPESVSVATPIRGLSVCPGAWFQAIHRDNCANKEYYKMAPSFPYVYEQAEETMHHMQEFDAADNVLVIIAHDNAPLDPANGFKLFPHGTLNDWKKDRLDERIRWSFLEDFAAAAENGLQQEKTLKKGLVLQPNRP